MPVILEDSTVCGIITRKDLDHAADVGPWRRNKPASKAFSMNRLARGIIHTFSFGSEPSSEQEYLLDNGEGIMPILKRIRIRFIKTLCVPLLSLTYIEFEWIFSCGDHFLTSHKNNYFCELTRLQGEFYFGIVASHQICKGNLQRGESIVQDL